MEVRPSVLPLSFTFTYEIQTRCHNVLLYEVLMGYILTLFCRNSTQYKSWLSYSQGKQIHRGCKKGYFHLCNPTNVKKNKHWFSFEMKEWLSEIFGQQMVKTSWHMLYMWKCKSLKYTKIIYYDVYANDIQIKLFSEFRSTLGRWNTERRIMGVHNCIATLMKDRSTLLGGKNSYQALWWSNKCLNLYFGSYKFLVAPKSLNLVSIK